MDDRTKTPEKAPKPEVALAFLHMPRQTCVGCSEYLLERGLVEVIHEVPLNTTQPGVVVRHYRIKQGVTLADCQEAVRGHHRGPRPWGMD